MQCLGYSEVMNNPPFGNLTTKFIVSGPFATFKNIRSNSETSISLGPDLDIGKIRVAPFANPLDLVYKLSEIACEFPRHRRTLDTTVG